MLERLTDPPELEFNAAILDERALWGNITGAYHDALRKCNHAWAPFTSCVRTSNPPNPWLQGHHQSFPADLRYPRESAEVLALSLELGG